MSISFDNKKEMKGRKVVVNLADGEQYDSLSEWRFAQLLMAYNIPFKHNEIKLLIESAPRSGYKPDFLFHREIDGLHQVDVIDVKGPSFDEDDKQKALGRDMVRQIRESAAYNEYSIRYFAIVRNEDIRVYDKDSVPTIIGEEDDGCGGVRNIYEWRGVEGGIFLCPECGNLEILPKEEPGICSNPACQHAYTQRDIECEHYKDFIEEQLIDDRQPRQLTEKEREYAAWFERKAAQPNIGINLLAPNAKMALARPDGLGLLESQAGYNIQAHTYNFQQKAFISNQQGTAFQLQSFVYACENPYTEDEYGNKCWNDDIRLLAEQTTWKESPVGQLIVICPDGMLTVERTDYTERNKRGVRPEFVEPTPADFYMCDEPGIKKGYVANRKNNACPFCGAGAPKEKFKNGFRPNRVKDAPHLPALVCNPKER